MRNVFSLPITSTSTSDLGGDVGRLRIEDGKIYKLMQNKTGGALAVGDVVFNGDSTVNPAGTYAFKLNQASQGTNLGLMAGVSMAVVADAAYFWAQVWGYNASIDMEGTVAIVAGAALKGVNGQYYVVSGTALGTAPLYSRLIIALEGYATAAAALKKGFIHCL